MTREEAIEIFKHLKENAPNEMHLEVVESAEELFSMAIQALSQEPCDDAISRDAVIKILEKYNLEMSKIAEDVSELPSVTQKPKTGHWIEHPEIETSAPEYLMFYECSECGDRQCFCKSDIHKKRFCSNCGCRMVEPRERSDKE